MTENNERVAYQTEYAEDENEPDFLESRQFYELMQAYRHERVHAGPQFQAVKAAIRAAAPAITQAVEPVCFLTINRWLDENLRRVSWNIESASFEISDEQAYRLVNHFCGTLPAALTTNAKGGAT